FIPPRRPLACRSTAPPETPSLRGDLPRRTSAGCRLHRALRARREAARAGSCATAAARARQYLPACSTPAPPANRKDAGAGPGPRVACDTSRPAPQLGLRAARLRAAGYRETPERGTAREWPAGRLAARPDRKSTRLNSSHLVISYAVFCLKKKNKHYCMHV